MEIVQKRFSILAIGFTIFTMFFGAGNIVFPLILGQYAQNQNLFGILGMSISAVIVPLIGLLSMVLYEGDYFKFFQKIGKAPGFLAIILILCIIGPLGAIPRCITISYSTMAAFGMDQLPGVNLISFSLLSCVLIFLCAFRPAHLMDVLGKILTPILLLALTIIVVKGLWLKPAAGIGVHTATETFFRGFLDGYNTMDLLATFFFSSAVLACLRQQSPHAPPQQLFSVAIGGSVLAALLLFIFYVGFSTLAAGYHECFEGIPRHQLLGTMCKQILGSSAGLIASTAVFFAVLTTELALAAIFAKFLHEHLFKRRISYIASLLMTLVVSCALSTLQFDGISRFLGPILQIFYPALIALTIGNILSKLYGIERTPLLFYGTLITTMAIKFCA